MYCMLSQVWCETVFDLSIGQSSMCLMYCMLSQVWFETVFDPSIGQSSMCSMYCMLSQVWCETVFDPSIGQSSMYSVFNHKNETITAPLNTYRPKQSEKHFADEIFKCSSVERKNCSYVLNFLAVCSSINIAWGNGLILHRRPAIAVWQQGASGYLFKTFMYHECVQMFSSVKTNFTSDMLEDFICCFA